MEINGNCVSTGAVAGVLAAVLFVIAMQIGYCYLGYRRAKNDELWLVNTEELHFSHPVEVIGQGSFGVVLLAEYRGNKVAIKRVIPQKTPGGSKHASRLGSMQQGSMDQSGSRSIEVVSDVENQEAAVASSTGSGGILKNGTMSTGDDDDDLDFLGGLSIGQRKPKWARFLPNTWFADNQTRYNLSILGTASGGRSSTSGAMTAIFCPYFDSRARRKQEFVTEMRLLSRLRHPCKFQIAR